ncbi:MAG: hypothetical protein RDU24_09000 [Humidesulfovibrio sp.]|uniref:hypothetical protein n=1 Tax=Humidesulfovibrio sp. TaxID=2910988 RepID=UPI0027F8D13A|nr:hypothetical protein [Humidesulfovibrio sp.]MDQ7835506.1 hypothetical protein [Humidesulfovibrio sp.]
MSQHIYMGPPEILRPKDEFTRAMWCPEVEEERRRARSDKGAAESELHHLKRFAVGTPSHGGRIFTLHLEFDGMMLASMAGNMEQARDFMWACVEEKIVNNLFRARRS